MADSSKVTAERAAAAASKKNRKKGGGAILLQYYLSAGFAIGLCVLGASLSLFGKLDGDEEIREMPKDDPRVPSEIASIVHGFDMDGDGRISMREIQAIGNEALKDAEQKLAFEGWADGFQEADVDGDGFLTAEEVRNLVSMVAKSSIAERFQDAQRQVEAESEAELDDEEEYDKTALDDIYPEADPEGEATQG